MHMPTNAPLTPQNTPRASRHPLRPGAPGRSRALAALLLCCGLLGAGALLASSGLAAQTKGHSSAHAAARTHVAHASRSSYETGIGDEQTEMFSDPNWQRLHTKITRYIAPYDAAVRSYSLDQAIVWIHDAEAAHQQVLVAFYHSEYTPLKMPSVATYQRDVERFIKLFPHVHQYQPWDEANRGTIPHALVSPTAGQAAEYYRALRSVCRGCTVVGLDVLDSPVIAPTLRYIAEFKREIVHLHVPMPTLWGLHNYSDTNRHSSSRTRAVLAAVPGDIWLTETGGIVQFGGAFPNVHGSGLRRAAGAISYMFSLAGISSRIRRLYVYDWSGGSSSTRFDAGLTDAHHVPRPGYLVVCRKLHAAGCSSVKISSH
jgi:hypothetical protein